MSKSRRSPRILCKREKNGNVSWGLTSECLPEENQHLAIALFRDQSKLEKEQKQPILLSCF